MKSADWKLIKSEYISDPKASYRKLAEKYGVSFNTLKLIAKKEKWPELRTQKQNKVTTKIIENCVKKEISQAEKIIKATDAIADRVIDAMTSMDLKDAAAVRQMTLALKDLREIYSLNKSILDEQEQKARIEALRAKTSGSDEDDTVKGVLLMPVVNGELVHPDE